jgi:hypothetical protein
LFRHLHLKALNPYDVVLTNVNRDSERDVGDFLYLADTIPLDVDILKRRYQEALRPYLFGDLRRVDMALDAWVDRLEQRRFRAH